MDQHLEDGKEMERANTCKGAINCTPPLNSDFFYKRLIHTWSSDLENINYDYNYCFSGRKRIQTFAMMKYLKKHIKDPALIL